MTALEDYNAGLAKKKLSIMIFFLLFIVVFMSAPFMGSHHINIKQAIMNPDCSDARIFFTIRLPRVILAAIAGGGLAVCGMVFQALLKNGLASPFTLGVASGASLGAVIAMLFRLDASFWGFSFVPVMSFFGALLAIVLVYLIARKSTTMISTYSLLLAGVAINLIFSSLILICQYMADFTQTNRMIRWLMGGLDILGFEEIIKAAPFMTAGLFIIFLSTSRLNLMAMGDDIAHSRGVDILKTQRICFLASSLVSGAVVSLSGPVGFVGLIIPHIVRMIVGPDHRLLFFGCLFSGAGFLILCDIIARTAISPREIPIGVITALVGGPFFIHLLRKEK